MAKKILIIDDDTDFLEATKMLLETEGFEVITADNGEQGFKKAKSDSPDIILLDVMMAHKSEGFDIARKLRRNDKTVGIPVIIVSGMGKEIFLSFGFAPDKDKLPVKAVMEKPIKPAELLKMIKENIG